MQLEPAYWLMQNVFLSTQLQQQQKNYREYGIPCQLHMPLGAIFHLQNMREAEFRVKTNKK